jgi:hypothetical protein
MSALEGKSGPKRDAVGNLFYEYTPLVSAATWRNEYGRLFARALERASPGTNSTFARSAVGGWEDRSSFPNTGAPRHLRRWCDRGLLFLPSAGLSSAR